VDIQSIATQVTADSPDLIAVIKQEGRV